MALARRVPEGDLIHHADHGRQYTSLEFTNRLADWNVTASYGSTGDCFDNAAMESTWATIKKEIRHIWGPWEQLTRHSSARSCSNTSRSSTTANVTKRDSITAPRPRPTLPRRQHDSQQPVSKIAGQLQLRASSASSCARRAHTAPLKSKVVVAGAAGHRARYTVRVQTSGETSPKDVEPAALRWHFAPGAREPRRRGPEGDPADFECLLPLLLGATAPRQWFRSRFALPLTPCASKRVDRRY